MILTGALPLYPAGETVRRLLPVLGFLGAVLVLGHFCQQEGLFTAAGARLAAVLANLVNNLPAILVLLSVLGPAGPGPVLAALMGVNIGPNLSYAGSLATLL